jgi:hypothetical protein
MENIESIIDLIKRNIRPGFCFKSGKNFYTIRSMNDLLISISYFDSIHEIPCELFYKIMYNENYNILIFWNNNESKSDKK